jgi:magnesium transporter
MNSRSIHWRSRTRSKPISARRSKPTTIRGSSWFTRQRAWARSCRSTSSPSSPAPTSSSRSAPNRPIPWTVVDGYTPIAESFEQHVEVLESELLGGAERTSDVLLEILEMKNDLTHFRRAVYPMRDILTPIMRGDRHLFAPADLPYYRDVQDHVARVLDQLDAARDLINNARDTHIAMATNRQQEAAKQLTLVATIFLPLTFITGFFGQNFGYLVNGIASARAFWWLGIGSEVVGLVALLAYFKFKRWF